MNLIIVLEFLVKTCSNLCATLNSTMLGKKVGNIIDNNVDNDTVTKTTGQLAWARSGSQIIDAQGALTQTITVRFLFSILYTLRNLQFHFAVIGRFKTSWTNQMFPAKRGIPAKVSCAISGLYYLCFNILTSHIYQSDWKRLSFSEINFKDNISCDICTDRMNKSTEHRMLCVICRFFEN